jgi:hypothetical protein
MRREFQDAPDINPVLMPFLEKSFQPTGRSCCAV